jgi:ABC-type lipoprotein release transport system permease subunit
LIGLSMQQQFGLHLGSIVTVPLYAKSQYTEILSSGYVVPHGPVVRFRVVGVEVSETDFPASTPSFALFTSPAFDSTIGRTIVRAEIVQLRLRHGESDMLQLQPYVNHHQGPGFVYLQDEVPFASTVSQSIQPQATGWWFFALFALLAGLALVGQALSRQSLVERESYPTLAALGLRPRQLWGLGMLRAATIGVAGAIGSVALAYAVSDLTPVGEARAATSGVGFVFSGVLFGLGALLVVATVMLLAVVPSWRAAQNRHGQNVRELPAGHAHPVVTMLARAGAPVSAVVGVRNALDRGRGRTSVPVVTALVGAVVAVAALVATTVFGASLTHLVRTPPLYGQNWQLDMGNFSTPQVEATVATLKADPEVTKITWGLAGKYVAVGRVPVEGVFVNVAKGPMAFSLVNGHAPHGDHEIILGSTTMSRAKLHVGSSVTVSLTTKNGKLHSGTFQVVGTVVLPPTFSSGGLGVGAVLQLHAAEELACPSGPRQAACFTKLIKETNGWGMGVGIASGKAGHAALVRYQHRYSKQVNVLSVPTNLVNFGQAVDFPLLLGVTMALFGAATLAHLLFVSIARRRRQVALLKVLGFVRRQVLFSTGWQAMTVVAIGLVIGVPLGVGTGQAIWRVFASHLGAVPVAVVPVALVVVVCSVITLGGLALALAPGALAVRVRPAEALREA